MKNIIYVKSKIQNKPPRLGQDIKTYHRNVSDLARASYKYNSWQHPVKSAYQLVCYSYQEDSYKDIHNKIHYELSKLPKYQLYPEDNYVIVIYCNGEIRNYYYYDDYKFLESFDPGIRLHKW